MPGEDTNEAVVTIVSVLVLGTLGWFWSVNGVLSNQMIQITIIAAISGLGGYRIKKRKRGGTPVEGTD